MPSGSAAHRSVSDSLVDRTSKLLSAKEPDFVIPGVPFAERRTMHMEIGGYRELDLRTGLEYYRDEAPARLNAGRCGIYHAVRCLGCHKVLLPRYQCETVRNFLLKKGMEVSYYHIGEDMLPMQGNQDDDTAIVLVNYFGLVNPEYLAEFASKHRNVIIDNTQGFYQANVSGAYSVYSPRKFFGVPDGCYVIGTNAARFLEEYPQDSSAPTAGFLLSRIESGGNANYAQYLESERRLDASDILRMSKLTQVLLDNIDYDSIRQKRQDNYDYAAKIFADINQLSPDVLLRTSKQVPMVYPLLIFQENLRYILKEHHVFVGQWWKYLLTERDVTPWEQTLSRYVLPIQIDQRYGYKEIDFVAELIFRSIQ